MFIIFYIFYMSYIFKVKHNKWTYSSIPRILGCDSLIWNLVSGIDPEAIRKHQESGIRKPRASARAWDWWRAPRFRPAPVTQIGGMPL